MTDQSASRPLYHGLPTNGPSAFRQLYLNAPVRNPGYLHLAEVAWKRYDTRADDLDDQRPPGTRPGVGSWQALREIAIDCHEEATKQGFSGDLTQWIKEIKEAGNRVDRRSLRAENARTTH